MSIRIGIYDFFAYTIPGVFYLMIAGFTVAAFGLAPLDWGAVNSLAFFAVIVLVGAGYVAGMILDSIAYRWMQLYLGRNTDQRRDAFDAFAKHNPQLKLNFSASDAELLLHILKEEAAEATSTIEMYNATGIMLRNISLGLAVLSLIFIAYYFIITPYLWNLLLAATCAILSYLSIERCRKRREWFYNSVFESIAAHSLRGTQWVTLADGNDTGN